MFPTIERDAGGENSLVSGTVLDDSRGCSNDALVAALLALGIEEDSKYSSARVVGDGIQGDGNQVCFFKPKSSCGKYSTAEMIKAWDDPTWHERNPQHPFAYIKCGLVNLWHLRTSRQTQAPLAKVRKGKKFALISLNASPAFEAKLLRRLDRRG